VWGNSEHIDKNYKVVFEDFDKSDNYHLVEKVPITRNDRFPLNIVSKPMSSKKRQMICGYGTITMDI
jgi:hypothetical protein